jgi:hypothetical protein
MNSTTRELFLAAVGDLPPAPFTVEAVAERGRSKRRLRMAIRTSAVAAAVVASAGVTFAVAPTATKDSPSPVAAGVAAAGQEKRAVDTVPAFTYTIKAGTAGPFRIEGTSSVTLGYEQARVVRDIAPAGVPGGVVLPSAELTVYRAGVFDPSDFASGGKTTVGGHPALTRTFAKDEPDPSGGPGPSRLRTAQVPAIAWTYGEDAWATLVATAGLAEFAMTAADVRAVAEKVTLSGSGTSAMLPYKLGPTPPGFRLVSVGVRDVDTEIGNQVSRAYLARDGVTFTRLTAPVGLRDGKDAGVVLSVSKKETEGPFPHPFDKCTNSHSTPGAFCDRAIPGSDYFVEVADPSGTLTPAQLGELADGLTFADPAAPKTWVPAAR